MCGTYQNLLASVTSTMLSAGCLDCKTLCIDLTAQVDPGTRATRSQIMKKTVPIMNGKGGIAGTPTLEGSIYQGSVKMCTFARSS